MKYLEIAIIDTSHGRLEFDIEQEDVESICLDTYNPEPFYEVRMLKVIYKSGAIRCFNLSYHSEITYQPIQ